MYTSEDLVVPKLIEIVHFLDPQGIELHVFPPHRIVWRGHPDITQFLDLVSQVQAVHLLRLYLLLWNG